MSTRSSVWDKILKVIIAVASALIGALSAHAMTV
ncbi:smalltalk protein [Bacteroides uniformis]|mgnify:FL=1|uniref:Smalltalk protein n=1 Tax=Bacteroides uniformis TaxID=820 RepID=A0AAW6H3S4_BACUN|nr:smalltalk protein [Bacteroides uniformis]MDC1889760.1 smalltalk protein [Bacteroides uniformis]MDC1894090.1 smalltalk protein [Bacteroides uniformis]MDC1900874.1 smalltalk protein [Bacteroides uniformis]MDC1910418.1 smalltalk protein [Bacteroides uniformis]